MILPGAEEVMIDIEKLRDYCLNSQTERRCAAIDKLLRKVIWHIQRDEKGFPASRCSGVSR